MPSEGCVVLANDVHRVGGLASPAVPKAQKESTRSFSGGMPFPSMLEETTTQVLSTRFSRADMLDEARHHGTWQSLRIWTNELRMAMLRIQHSVAKSVSSKYMRIPMVRFHSGVCNLRCG